MARLLGSIRSTHPEVYKRVNEPKQPFRSACRSSMSSYQVQPQQGSFLTVRSSQTTVPLYC
jgi:hypothetical protein